MFRFTAQRARVDAESGAERGCLSRTFCCSGGGGGGAGNKGKRGSGGGGGGDDDVDAIAFWTHKLEQANAEVARMQHERVPDTKMAIVSFNTLQARGLSRVSCVGFLFWGGGAGRDFLCSDFSSVSAALGLFDTPDLSFLCLHFIILEFS